MRRCFKKVGELIKDQMDNFNEEGRDTLSIPIPGKLQFFKLLYAHLIIFV